MFTQTATAIRSLIVLTLLTGVAYPLAMTTLAQGVFPRQANGSLIMRQGRAAGSSLIGQPFTDRAYFWGRLSATGPAAFNAAASTGSNLGPLNPALAKAVEDRLAALHAADPGNQRPVPVDLVTASGSGLDPHISPAAARYQAPRVARARGVPEPAVLELIQRHTTGRWLGLLGEPAVNVLALNLALDDLAESDRP
jgi:K+-transporting ATPase ATPase C chain